MIETAIVSSRARPSPSMMAPIMPPRPKGSTTVRIICQRLAPSARAASRSPAGARENTSRQMDATIGTIMMPTTRPAMKIDALSGGLVTLKNGMNDAWRDSQVLSPTTLPWSSKKAHRPKMMLGMAAARSIRAMNDRREPIGAYSLRKRAVQMATGAPTIMATKATSTVPTSEASTPKSECEPIRTGPEWVKNPHPATLKAGHPDQARNEPMATSSRKTPRPDSWTPRRKMRSGVE